MAVTVGEGGLVEAARSPRVERVFRFLGRRMFNKDFHAVRAAPGSLDTLTHAADLHGPLTILGNHVSWWDPMLAVLLTDRLMPDRAMIAAMDTDELLRFGVFRKLGVFGIRPGDPDALTAMVRYLQRELEREPRSVFWVTPQGEFADVRTTLRLRPGTAAALSRLGSAGVPIRALTMAVEYGFGVERKPEIFLRIQPLEPPTPRQGTTPSMTDWLRAMTHALQHNMHTLAELVQQRDPCAFETLLGGEGGSVNPVYDAWQRLRGTKRSLNTSPRANTPTDRT